MRNCFLLDTLKTARKTKLISKRLCDSRGCVIPASGESYPRKRFMQPLKK